MPIHAAASFAWHYIPSSYYLPTAIGVSFLAILYIFGRGRVNTRLRDMHARTVIMTGGLSPLGLTVANALALQGASLILLVPSLSSSDTITLITLLRETTKNENIHAAECDLLSPASIRAFCAEFVKTAPAVGSREPPRVDAIVFCHEAEPILLPGKEGGRRRFESNLASFLITTLLLPVLLRAPPTRDIRIITVVRPLYAAATRAFPSMFLHLPLPEKFSIAEHEGGRAMRAIVWARHLQRVLDALVPVSVSEGEGGGEAKGAAEGQVQDEAEVKGLGEGAGQRAGQSDGQLLGEPSVEQAAGQSSGEPEEKPRQLRRRSNILSMSVCPGFRRSDFTPHGKGPLRYLFWFLTYPLLFLLTKSTAAASQSILFTLFAPTTPPSPEESFERVVGGELFRECRVVPAPLGKFEFRGRMDEDWGGEWVGRRTWENMEDKLKRWVEREKREKEAVEEEAREKGKAGEEAGESVPAEEKLDKGKGKAKRD